MKSAREYDIMQKMLVACRTCGSSGRVDGGADLGTEGGDMTGGALELEGQVGGMLGQVLGKLVLGLDGDLVLGLRLKSFPDWRFFLIHRLLYTSSVFT